MHCKKTETGFSIAALLAITALAWTLPQRSISAMLISKHNVFKQPALVYVQFKVFQGTVCPKQHPSTLLCFLVASVSARRARAMTTMRVSVIVSRCRKNRMYDPKGITAVRAFKRQQSTPCLTFSITPPPARPYGTRVWRQRVSAQPVLLNGCANWFRRAERSHS